VGEIIVITSGKGGVGKTTSVAALGVALSLLDQKTLIVDLDIGLRNLDLVSGISDRTVNHWGDVIRKKCSLENALVTHPNYPLLHILSAPQWESHQNYTNEEMKSFYQRLASQFDFVLIDSPTGAEYGFSHAVCGAEKALVLVQGEITSVRDGDKIAHFLSEQGCNQIYLMINRFQPSLVQEGIVLSIEQMIDAVKLPLIGIIPEDIAITKSVNSGKSVFQFSDSKSAKCYENIAKRLLGKEVPLTVFKTKPLLNRLKITRK